MSLPKSIRPEYNTTVPSTGKKIKYQPFSVKEEKVLILAAESQDTDEIANAISNVLSRCITTPADFKVSDLAIFDIEYLFLKCRSKSAGEKIKVRVTDPNDPTYTTDHEIDIDKIRIHKNDEHSKLITLNDEVTLKMRYPDIEFFAEGLKIDTLEESVGTVARCVEQIVVGEEVYNSEDMSNEEVAEWLEGMTTEQFSSIMKFFETMPRLKHQFKIKNKKTGNDFEITLEGLADFF